MITPILKTGHVSRERMRKLKILDVCTEFGSETKPFKDRGHEVITLGIEGNVDLKMDVRDYHYEPIHGLCEYDAIFFHPPCDEFSIANNFHLGSWKDRTPDMSIVEACFRIVKEANPKYWILENPAYGLRHFWKIPPFITIKYSDFGAPFQKKTDLWGRFPIAFLQHKTLNYKTINLKYASSLLKTNTGIDRKKNRALIPYNLGLAWCKALEDAYAYSGQ